MKKFLFLILILSIHSFALQSYEFQSWNKVDFKKDSKANYTYFNLNRLNQPLLANILYYGNTKVDLELYIFNEEMQSFTRSKFFSDIDPLIKDAGINRVETDIEDNLWILAGGIIYYERENSLSQYQLPQIYGDTLLYKVAQLFMDYNGIIWFLMNSGEKFTEGGQEIFKVLYNDWFTIQNNKLVHISSLNVSDLGKAEEVAQGFQRINQLFQNPYTHQIYGIDQFAKFSNGYTENGMYEVDINGIKKTFPIKRHTIFPNLKDKIPLNINHVEFTSDGKKIIYAFDKVSLGSYFGGVSIYNTQDNTWEIIEENPNFNYEQMENEYGSRYEAARYVEGSVWIFNFWGWIEIFNGKEVRIMKTTDFLTYNYASENPQISKLFTQNSRTFWLKSAYWDIIRIEENESSVNDLQKQILKCYPVPAKVGEEIIIELDENEAITSLQLIDYLGKILIRKEITFEAKISINTNGLSKGCYFIVLQTQNNLQIPIKIVLE